MTSPLPVYPVVSAEGCELILSDGRRLVDGMSSWWAAIHGYNHPQLNAAMKSQIDAMSHVMFGGITHAPAIELCRKLVAMTPQPLECVFLADSGSVAVEVAMKMALQYWQAKGEARQRFLTFRNGYHGDTSRMFVVGKPTIAGKRLVDLAFETMWAGIDAVRPGGHFNDIGVACEEFVRKNGVSVVHDYGGHGIGKKFHEEPFVYHYDTHKPGPELLPGMVFTVEPMVNAGRYGVTMLGDGWTVVTKDRSLSAQWEHMVVVTETGYDVLTVSEGTREPPAFVKGWKKPEHF